MRIAETPEGFTYDMSRHDVLVTNATYYAFDYARRRGTRLSGIVVDTTNHLPSDLRVTFPADVPSIGDTQLYSTQWVREDTGNSLYPYESAAAPDIETLHEVFDSLLVTLFTAEERTHLLPPLSSSLLLRASRPTITGSFDIPDFSHLAQPIRTLARQLTKYWVESGRPLS